MFADIGGLAESQSHCQSQEHSLISYDVIFRLWIVPCLVFLSSLLTESEKNHGLKVVMVLELIEVLGLRHFRRTPERENGDERWWLTWTNREPSLDKLLRQTGVWAFMNTACVLRRKGCSWQGVKIMSVLNHAAAEMLVIAACLQVGCL